MKQKKVPIHYVDNKKFFQEILIYREKLSQARQNSLEDVRIPNYIGECIMKIAVKLSTKPCFMNYSFREEMISDGIENCILYFKDYDPEKGSNPFAYFTQIIYYAFLRRISKEEKNRYIIYNSFRENIVDAYDSNLLTDSEGNHLLKPKMYDNMNDFMTKFEYKEQVKKEKHKLEKQGLIKFYEE
jgi:hypothetical protein